MTAPGGINIPITADGSDFDTQLREAVMGAMQSVQVQLDANPLNVKVHWDINADQLRTQVAAAVNSVGTQTIHVDTDVSVDADNVRTRIETALASVQSATIRVDADVSLDTDAARAQAQAHLDANPLNVKVEADTSAVPAQVEAAMREIQQNFTWKVKVPVEPDFSEFPQKVTQQLTEMQALYGWALTIPVDVDGAAALARMLALRRQLEGMTQPPITQQVDVNVDRDGAARTAIRTLTGSLGSIGTTAAGLSAVAAGIAAIGGAAGAAAGLVGGLVVGLTALGPAAAAGIATGVVAMQGIGDAFSALSDAAENGGKEAAAATKQVAAAQDQLESALDGVDSAQRSLTDAQEDAADAQRDLSDAYQLAAEDLEDLQFKLRGSVLDQKEAALALREAQKDVFEAGLDPEKREKALLRLERAQLNYDKSLDATADTQAEWDEAQAKGIENSDRVTAARERAADADQRVADAQRQLTKANEQVARAQQAVTDAQNAALPSTEKLNQALADLAPNAAAFVLAAHGLSEEWEDLRKSVQDNMFEESAASLTNLADAVFPSLREGMGAVATEFNLGARGFADFVASGRGIAGLDATFANTAGLLRGMREGSVGFLDSLSAMAQATQPFAEQVGRAFGGIGTEIGNAFRAMSDSGQLGEVLTGLSATFQGLGPLLRDLLISFAELGAQVLPGLQPLFESLGQALVTMSPALGSLGDVFARSLAAVLPGLGEFVAALAEGLEPVLPVVVQLLNGLLTALQPLIGPLSEIAVTVGSALVSAVNALAPSVGPVGAAFAALVNAVAPLVPLLAEELSVILTALAPALTEVFNALAPVISQLAEQMRPVIEQIAPVLAEVAMTIGLALADAVRQLAPVLPEIVRSFSGLLLAVVPLIPQLVKMAAEILPPLIDVFVQFAPFLTRVIDLLTWLVENVIIPLVIPYFQQMTDGIKDNLEFLADAFEWWDGIVTGVLDGISSGVNTLKDTFNSVKEWFVTTLLPAFSNALVTLRGWFDTGMDGISKAWKGLEEAAKVPVRFVVNTVWNNGLLKAWNTVAEFLKLPEMTPVTLGFARGGGVFGPGTGTSDSIPAWLSAGEHVVTAAEVVRAGGHNILYAIRDMIARGIPFAWDNGQLITDLGRGNLDAYGAAVKAQGIGNVDPQGLFDPVLPRRDLPGFARGGAVEPWMRQLLRGHEFARAQHGKPYQWAGPTGPGSSFDCSGFMGSIAAAILGDNPWRRYWATSSFGRAQRAVGPQGFVAGVGPGFTIGVTDDPGGPGGGHTAGTLSAIPALGVVVPVNVESGGRLGNVHYGGGPDPRSFLTQYHLPLGANGFFQPGVGGGSVGPSPDDQLSFVERRIRDVLDRVFDPIRDQISSAVGDPPPKFREIPPAFLDYTRDKAAGFLGGVARNLGGALPAAWEAAKSIGANVLDALNPFDSGGVIAGPGVFTSRTREPERVLSPAQTRLFETMVMSLERIASGTSAAPDVLTASVFQQGINHLADVLGVQQDMAAAVLANASDQQMERTHEAIESTGRVVADTAELVQRSESSQEQVIAAQFEQMRAVLTDIAGRLTNGALVPIIESGMDAAVQVVEDWLNAGFEQVTDGTDRTTAAVKNLDVGGGADTTTAEAPFGAPGSAFDAATAISNAIVSVADTAASAFSRVAQDVANAALQQRPSRVDQSKGVLGRDISGGTLVDTLVALTGVEIEIRDVLYDTYDEILSFRGEMAKVFDTSGRIVADTAELMQRNESSRDAVISEQNRLNRELIKALLRYLMTAVVIPIMTAILGAMIQLATTAIGAAIGSIIPGIGTAIGAAIGAVVGAALAGAAAVFTSVLAVGAAAAIDSFDSGGVAHGKGMLAKDIVEPERVLSPRQTVAFERLVDNLDRRPNLTVNAPFTVLGGSNVGMQARDGLLSLLNS